MKYRYLMSFLIAGSVAALFAQAQPGAQPTPPSDQQAMIKASSICDVGTTYDQLTSDERKPPARIRQIAW